MEHVLQGSFTARRHARLLEGDRSLLEFELDEDDPRAGWLLGLARLQLTYQEAARMRDPLWKSHLARLFERDVADRERATG